jgi:hypothetical protein
MLEPLLVPVDRVCLRWAASIGDGQFRGWRDEQQSRPPQLPDDLALEVDQIILAAPPEFIALLKDWYKTSKSIDQIASGLGIGRDAAYVTWRSTLWYLLGVFRERRIIERVFRNARH